MIVSDKVRGFYDSGSAIRKMFDEGLRLKARYGGAEVADLSIGNPTFPPPEEFTRALQAVAFQPGPHAYMPNAGYPHVRERVAEYLDEHDYLRGATEDHVVMTTGAAGALNIVLKTILEPGDQVIVPRPYFVEYRFYVDTHGGRLVLVDTREDFSLDPKAVEAAITPHTRALLLNSPNNPSGRMYTREDLEAVADVLTRASRRFGRPILLLSDEPYREVLFDDVRFVSPVSVYPYSFMCYSWSKAFSISGERIGYVAARPELAEADPLLMGALAMCNRFLGFVNAPAFMQHVIATCIEADLDMSHYAEKRDRLCAALDDAGYDYAMPEGTFYLFPRTLGDEARFIRRAKESLLLVVPGSAFGRPGHFRISFAADDHTVDLACEKLKALAKDHSLVEA